MCGLLKALNLKLPDEGQAPKQDAKAAPVKEKPGPNLTVGPLANFEYGTVSDIPKTIAAVVKRDGDGKIAYDPDLSTVGMPKAYVINVSVDEGTAHKKDGPKPLAFTIDGADPKLVVGGGFEAFVENDIEALVRGAVSCVGGGTLSFDKSWADLKKEAAHVLQVAVQATTTHRAAGPLPMDVVVRRRKPALKVLGTIPDSTCELEPKPQAEWVRKVQAGLPKLIDRDGSAGALIFTPPLAKLANKPGEFTNRVCTAETDTCLRSDDVTVSFKVRMSVSDATRLFSTWWDANSKKLAPNQMQSLKQAGVKSAYDFRQLPKAALCATPEDVTKLIQELCGEAKAGRDKIWALLGYPALSGSSAWLMEDEITLVGHKFHITISFNSTALPTAALTGSAEAIFTQLFHGPNADLRVHGTLQFVGGTGAEQIHLYLGGVDGANKLWATKISSMQTDAKRWVRDMGDAREAQITAMQERLTAWKTKMVNAITAKATGLGELKF